VVSERQRAAAGYFEDAMRHGAAVRAERDHRSERDSTSQAARDSLHTLSDQLVEQQSDLTRLGTRLRLPASPHPTGPPPAVDGPGAVLSRLRRAGECVRIAEAAATEAERLGELPALFPRWSPQARNAVVYGACSLAGLLLQFGMIALHQNRVVTDQFTTYSWTCCGFPAFAFIAGYLLVGILGKPRLSDIKAVRTPRMGALICAASLPVATAVLGLLGQLF
jgi:hypothetical protein